MVSMRRALFVILLISACSANCLASTRESSIYVSPDGRDNNPWTDSRALASLGGAQRLARKYKTSEPVTVWLRGGTYF